MGPAGGGGVAPPVVLQTATPTGGSGAGGDAGAGTGADAGGIDAATLVASLLERVGVPEAVAAVLGAAITFVVVLVGVYLLGRALLLPLTDRVLDSRGMEAHARRPITKLTHAVVAFAGVAVAFGLAGYGDFLQSLATIAAAATLAVGLAL